MTQASKRTHEPVGCPNGNRDRSRNHESGEEIGTQLPEERCLCLDFDIDCLHLGAGIGLFGHGQISRHDDVHIRKTDEAIALKALKRPLLIGTGWTCVVLGAIGIVMPLFPTTPFLLVAVWAFSKSSPEMAEKIRNHRLAGPYVRDWQDEGIIPLGAKIIAITMMSAALGYLHFGSNAPAWAVISAAAVMAMAAGYILSRPSRRRLG